ncbi:MAG: hypothetical protein KDD44_04740 [Bdellovibrionales bacterium]|nr:hypothetical protein [Bdellovibrionales bacterium]
MPPVSAPAHGIATERLRQQLLQLRETGATTVVLAGNHDWGGTHGVSVETLLRQEQLVESVLGPGSFLPPAGCPGPAIRKLFPNVQLVALDSQLLLFSESERRDVRAAQPTRCPETTGVSPGEQLRQALEHVQLSLIALHHPPESGAFSEARSVPCPQRHGCKRYEDLRRTIQLAARGKRAICLAGHDHNLQIIQGGVCPWTIVSGALSDVHQMPRHPGATFHENSNGVVRLDITGPENVRARVFVPSSADPSGQLRFEAQL